MAYDGVICRVELAMARRIKKLKIALLNTWFNTPARNVTSVVPDFEAIGRLGAEHLLSRGFQRFSYFIATMVLHQQMHYRGFSQCLEEAGLHCDIVLHPMEWNQNARQWTRMRRGYPKVAGISHAARGRSRRASRHRPTRGHRLP